MCTHRYPSVPSRRRRRTGAGPWNFVRWTWVFVATPLCMDKAGVEEGMEIISKAVSIADEACV